MSVFLVVPVLVVLLVLALVVSRDDNTRARLLRQAALGFIIGYAALAALFIAGETFDDPGGWAAVAMVLIWAVPLTALALTAWFRPAAGQALLGAATAASVALGVWYTVAPEAWRSFEDHTGPVRALVTFVVAVPLGLLGWHRPVQAGALLVTLGVVPVVLAGLTEPGRALAATSLGIVSAPAVLVGALYLVSAGFAARHHGPAPHPTDSPTASPGPGPAAVAGRAGASKVD